MFELVLFHGKISYKFLLRLRPRPQQNTTSYESLVLAAEWSSQHTPSTDPSKNLIGFAQITEVVLGSPRGAVAMPLPAYLAVSLQLTTSKHCRQVIALIIV